MDLWRTMPDKKLTNHAAPQLGHDAGPELKMKLKPSARHSRQPGIEPLMPRAA